MATYRVTDYVLTKGLFVYIIFFFGENFKADC